MSHFIRASKFRHVYVEPAKTDQTYTGLKLSTATGEQNYIKANTKFFCVSLQGGGGPMYVCPHAKVGRFETGAPIITGHSGPVLDFDFNPFHEHLIASASDDCTVKVWGIPEHGLTENITEPLVDLHGHKRKATLCKFHPTAEHVLGSASADFTVKVWDIEKGGEITSLSGGMSQLIQDFSWDYCGDLVAATSKDKSLRVFDPRTGALAMEKKEAHEGSKSMKCVFLGSKDKLVSVGFTKQSQRQFKIWDHRNMEKELKRVDIDQAAGVIMPFYDEDANLLYLAGKGDGNIRYYEMVDETPYTFPVSEYRSTNSQKGIAFVPKRGLDIMSCETARLLKLTTNAVEPLRFIVPRKSDAFQDDIFPDTYAGVPSLKADEWLGGESKPPVLVSLRPGGTNGGGGAGVPKKAFTPPKSAVTLQKELDVALARIAELEAKLAAAGITEEAAKEAA